MPSQNGTKESEVEAKKTITYDPLEGAFYDTNDEKLPFSFDVRNRTFTTAIGMTFKFHPMNMSTALMFQESYAKKYEPEMPQRAIEYDEGKFYLEGNPNDPKYAKDHSDFETSMGIALLQYIYNVSILGKVPDKKEWPEMFLERVELMEQVPDKRQLKYMWIDYHLTSQDEADVFARLAQGQNYPTREALEMAEARFPGDGE